MNYEVKRVSTVLIALLLLTGVFYVLDSYRYDQDRYGNVRVEFIWSQGPDGDYILMVNGTEHAGSLMVPHLEVRLERENGERILKTYLEKGYGLDPRMNDEPVIMLDNNRDGTLSLGDCLFIRSEQNGGVAREGDVLILSYDTTTERACTLSLTTNGSIGRCPSYWGGRCTRCFNFTSDNVTVDENQLTSDHLVVLPGRTVRFSLEFSGNFSDNLSATVYYEGNSIQNITHHSDPESYSNIVHTGAITRITWEHEYDHQTFHFLYDGLGLVTVVHDVVTVDEDTDETLIIFEARIEMRMLPVFA